jgi:acyl-CoA thioesterase FadM
MRAFDVVVSQSMGRVGESSFEFLYSIREVDNRTSDGAGKLLATALAVCVPVKQPGERMPISDSFRALVAQSQEAASRRVSAPDGDVAGEAYVEGDGTTNGGEVTGRSPTAGQPADRLMLQQMLTLQSSSFDAPDVFDNSKLEVHGHIMTLPMVLRPSDEDWNHHINNTSFIRFFDDALCIMRETMTEVRNLASVTPSKAAFDYLAECSLGCTKCHILCKFYDGSEAEGVDDGMHAWNPDGLASIAMIFRGMDTGGQERVFARARYAFPKV